MANSPICSIPCCGKPVDRRGWCTAHYTRWHRHGDPLGQKERQVSPLVRFLEDVAIPCREDNCLEWPFGKRRNGYGAIRLGTKNHEVHQIVCARVHGEGRSGEEVAHNCGNRACCNPMHLRWATRSENHADKREHGTLLRGTQIKQAKLTEDQVRQIRALDSGAAAAEMFGVSVAQARRIQRRERWAWLE